MSKATRRMNSASQVSVGIVSAGMYLPERIMSATDIAEESGLPEWVIREELGINEKRMGATRLPLQARHPSGGDR